MPQTKERKREYMREYMRQRRHSEGLTPVSKEGLTSSFVSPSMLPIKLPNNVIRAMRRSGANPETALGVPFRYIERIEVLERRITLLEAQLSVQNTIHEQLFVKNIK